MNTDQDETEPAQTLNDPARSLLPVTEDLPQRLAALGEPLRGEPAFDPALIRRLAEAVTLPDARFDHPLLEQSVRTGLAHIDATFQGEHPKYGTGAYARPEHDGFPPTIIAAVDALTLWDGADRAERLFAYWLRRFVREDGSIDYYGPSLSEYGQLLTTARRLWERGGSGEGLREQAPTLRRLAACLQKRIGETGQVGLPKGVPEADTRTETATYFHNSAWMARGLEDWAALLAGSLRSEPEAQAVRADAARLRELTVKAIRDVWPRDPQDWWLSPITESLTEGAFAPPQGCVTATPFGSYTNYRYWPELLSSGVLPPDLKERIVTARLTSGGQFYGMTRFETHLDDWPLMEHMEGLWSLGRHDDYRLCLWGHILYHQAEGYLTAYEQVSLPPGRKKADYCLPCQLVAARAARRLV